MKNKEIKKQMLENGVYDDFRAFLTRLYKDDINYQDLDKSIVKTLYESYTGKPISQIEVDSGLQMKKARCTQKREIMQHVKFMREDYGKLYFITLTFDDDYLQNTSIETRRQKVRRFLSEHCIDYIGNIDYGKDDRFTKREHYHAIIQAPDASFVRQWPFMQNYEEIRNTDDDLNRTSWYDTKLSLHSLKVKKSHLISPRNSKYIQYKKAQKRLLITRHSMDENEFSKLVYLQPTKDFSIHKMFELYYQ